MEEGRNAEGEEMNDLLQSIAILALALTQIWLVTTVASLTGVDVVQRIKDFLQRIFRRGNSTGATGNRR